MGAKIDQLKGEAKEAVGTLTGDKDSNPKAKRIVVLVRPKRSSTT